MSGRPSASQDFYERVFEVVEQIPYGRVTTYGAIAQYLGSGGSSRMVGYALNKSLEFSAEKGKPMLPCHRVVNRLGQLTGKSYFGPGVMEALLRQEDIRFIEADTIDIDKHFWDPSEALPRPYTSN